MTTNPTYLLPINNVLMGGLPGARTAAASPTSPSFSDVLRTQTMQEISSGSADLDAAFERAGQEFNISPNILKAVARAESGFNPNATSRAGAMGIMQLMPGTARGLGVEDAYDPEQNIRGGAKYLRVQLDRYDGDLELALAAYNAGPGNVAKYGGVPPFKETQNYIPKVLGYLGGGPVTPEMTTYNGSGISGTAVAPIESVTQSGRDSSPDFSKTLTQMLFMQLITMQMNSGGDRKDTPAF